MSTKQELIDFENQLWENYNKIGLDAYEEFEELERTVLNHSAIIAGALEHTDEEYQCAIDLIKLVCSYSKNGYIVLGQFEEYWNVDREEIEELERRCENYRDFLMQHLNKLHQIEEDWGVLEGGYDSDEDSDYEWNDAAEEELEEGLAYWRESRRRMREEMNK